MLNGRTKPNFSACWAVSGTYGDLRQDGYV
jgi:hypothetical protein